MDRQPEGSKAAYVTFSVDAEECGPARALISIIRKPIKIVRQVIAGAFLAILSLGLNGQASSTPTLVPANDPSVRNCQRLLKDQEITIATFVAPYTIDNTKTHEEISRYRKGIVTETNVEIRGLLTFNFQTAFNLQWQSTKTEQGKQCAKLGIVGNIGYTNLEILIDKRFAPNSCEYEQILAHEKLHLSHLADDLEKISGLLQEHFSKKYKGHILLIDGELPTDQIDAELRSIVSQFTELSKRSAKKVDLENTWDDVIEACKRQKRGYGAALKR